MKNSFMVVSTNCGFALVFESAQDRIDFANELLAAKKDATIYFAGNSDNNTDWKAWFVTRLKQDVGPVLMPEGLDMGECSNDSKEI